MNSEAMKLLSDGCAEIGIMLNADQSGQFASFGDELKRWNKKINLTAIKDDKEIVVKHFLDSLTLVTDLKGDESLLDMGSGGGFPCVPLKIVLPKLRITSIDAVVKKVMFQRHVGRLLGFADFNVLHARLEKPDAAICGKYDVVTARAFARLDQIVNLAKPYLKSGGVLYALKGDAGVEIEATAEAMNMSGALLGKVREFELPCWGGRRTILTIKYIDK